MTGVDTVIVVDWSARSVPSPARPCADAIWIGTAQADGLSATYVRTRDAAMTEVDRRIRPALQRGERVLLGFDFPFGYPAGTAAALGAEGPLGLWRHLDGLIADGPDNANNRHAVAAELNRRLFGDGPFWGCPRSREGAHLRQKRPTVPMPLPRIRRTEALSPGAQECWKLAGAGSVGSQALLGLPRLHRLRAAMGDSIAVWPFEPPDAPVVLAEVFPSIVRTAVAAVVGRCGAGVIRDEVQVTLLAAALLAVSSAGRLPDLFAAAAGPADEGWILGAHAGRGPHPVLAAAADATVPLAAAAVAGAILSRGRGRSGR